MGLYKQPKSDNWYTRFTHQGREYRRSTGTASRREAAKVARQIRAEAEATAPAPCGTQHAVALIQLGGLDAERAASKGVSEEQNTSIELSWAHLCRFFGANTDPATITYDGVEEYIRHRRAAGTRGQSIRKDVQALKRGLMIAKRRKLIADALAEWPEVKSDPKNPGQAGKTHPIGVVMTWLDELGKKHPMARDQAELCLRLGLRAFEVRRLCRSWVVEAPENSQVPARLILPDWATKNRRERTLGVTTEALVIITRLAIGKLPDEPLCPGLHYKAATAARKRLKYHRNITLRDLRHMHGTYGAMGGDVRAVQAALGHADLKTTERYLHSSLERTAATAVTVGTHLNRHTRVGIPAEPSNSLHEHNVGGKEDNKSRGGRIRTYDTLLPKQLDSVLSAVLACPKCAHDLERIIEMHLDTHPSRHTGSAYLEDEAEVAVLARRARC